MNNLITKNFLTKKNILKIFLGTLFITFFNFSSYSQRFFVNGLFGTANYEGDLQDNFFTFSQPKSTAGGGISYKLTNNIFLRAGVTFASVTADDKKNSKVYFRNLNFTSAISEFHVAAEYYLFDLDEKFFSPYVFGGLGVFHFNPYTRDTAGVKYFLQPLSTEGEGFYDNRQPYNLTQLCIPFGAGIKLAVTNNIYIGIEAGMRKLFTDYLDDVSTTYVDPNLILVNRGPKAVELAYRGGELKNGDPNYPTVLTKRGEPKNKDWYYFTGITLSLRLPSRGEIDDRWSSTAKGKRSRVGCPKPVY